jgi:hypothetical protein
MATTTNYGWDTPDDTDLVKDGAAAIRTLGSSVDTTTKALNPSTTLGDIEYRSSTANTNTRLGVGTSGQVLTVAAGVPSWATPAAGMTNPLTTTGDTIYSSSGSTPARLGIGTTGQVLTVAGGVPSWATASAGAVKQVVTATYGTSVSTAGTEVDTGLTATITPSSTGSKIIVVASIPQAYLSVSTTATSADATFVLLRGATEITTVNYGGYLSVSGGAGKELYMPQTFMRVDSPSTTSATTYKVTIKTGQSATTGSTQASTALPISITLMEI